MSHPDKSAELIDRETTVILQDPQQHRNKKKLKKKKKNRYTLRLICKYLDVHLSGNNSVSSGQQLLFLILTSTGLILMIFYSARESSVQGQQVERASQKHFWKSVECCLPWLMKKICDFRLVKMGKFCFFSIYSTHLRLPISKPIFHSHNSQNLQDV